jgi:hypothetical protein
MALNVNGTEPEAINVNGNSVNTLKVNGEVVWEAYSGPPSPVIITESGTYVAGVDFPANTEITICMVGGGGSGAAGGVGQGAGGGYSGGVINTTRTYTRGESIEAVIGSGGSRVGPTSNGSRGGTTSFGDIEASGGAGGTANGTGYPGGGGERNTCGGTGNDGAKEQYGFVWGYGGQSSGFSNGGKGSHTIYNANGGGVGSGGGGLANGLVGYYSGSGGRGEIRLSW